MFASRLCIFTLCLCCCILRTSTSDSSQQTLMIEIERLKIAGASSTTGLYYSIDKFKNVGGSLQRRSICSKHKAICDDDICERCACRDFDTFVSYTAGCLPKDDKDDVLGGKKINNKYTVDSL